MTILLTKTGAVTSTVPIAPAVLTLMTTVKMFMMACRLWVHDEDPSQTPFALRMLRVASAAPAQYIKLMNQSGIHLPPPSLLYQSMY